jgi:hypothetical protein
MDRPEKVKSVCQSSRGVQELKLAKFRSSGWVHGVGSCNCSLRFAARRKGWAHPLEKVVPQSGNRAKACAPYPARLLKFHEEG